MPDAKSLLPGRAFRSEHAQLRPEPHSIASHGPAPMDPLQTTRMRNGVLYAAEWPCCHDPLRLSLGSEDPFYIHNPRVRRARLRTPHPHPGGGGRARRALRVRAPPPRAGRRAPNALPNPPSNPSRRRARAPMRPRAQRVAFPNRTGVSLPSRRPRPDPNPILKRASFRSTLAAPPTHPMRPTLAMCPSCPRRRPYPFSLSVIYSPHTASARTPLPIHSSPARAAS